MLFHTSTFLVFFIAFLAFYLPARRTPAGVWVLLVFSSIFYGWWNIKFLGLLWVTIIVDFTLATWLVRTQGLAKRRLLLAMSVVTNLGILGFFKYFNFFLDTVDSMGVVGVREWQILDLTLPVGISFYVFQSMSYTIDVYRKQQQPIRSFIEYAAFVCYFPQLVAGPIERLHNLLPQLKSPGRMTPDSVTSGGFLFCVGFFRKSIADTLGTFVDPVFNGMQAALPAEVVLALFGFGIQIYLDFTGYVDMARGISRVLGIELSLNFNAPYLARSAREFWRRWHISLSEWLRDYLYISLGGNRHGFARHLLALMVTMVLGGLWHGAGLNFLIWGALQGLYLIANVLWDKARSVVVPETANPVESATGVARWIAVTGRTVYSLLTWFVTFMAMNYAWLYFRSHTFETAMTANVKMLEWLLQPSLPVVYPALATLVGIVVVMELIYRFRPSLLEVSCGELTFPRAVCQGTVGGGLFLAGVILLAGVPTQQFIYFQF